MQRINLSIPEPCHENWDNMSLTSQGRFCSSCAKQVIDFSNMSDGEVLNYFSVSKQQNVCGRLAHDQLNRTIQLQKSKNALWYWRYVLAFFLMAGKSITTKAQMGKMKTTCIIPAPKPIPSQVIMAGGVIKVPQKFHLFKKKKLAKTAALNSRITLKGIIKDESGRGIPFVSLTVLPFNTGVSADENGKYSIKLNPVNSSLKISAVGYEDLLVDVFDHIDQNFIIKKTFIQMEELLITSYGGRRMGSIVGGMMMVTTRRTIKDSITQFFSKSPGLNLYPNPVQKNNIAHLNLKTKPGRYSLQIADATGRILRTTKLTITNGDFIEAIEIESTWSSGQYFISLFNEKHQLQKTTRFIVM